jgi:hypothetical protein
MARFQSGSKPFCMSTGMVACASMARPDVFLAHGGYVP